MQQDGSCFDILCFCFVPVRFTYTLKDHFENKAFCCDLFRLGTKRFTHVRHTNFAWLLSAELSNHKECR